MKKLLRMSLIVTVLSGILFSMVTPGLAQDVQPPTEPTPIPLLENGFVPFSALDEEDILMRGPFSSADVRFTLPSSWKVEAGASLNLVMTAAFSSLESLNIQSSGASLRVDFNDITVATLFITEGVEQEFNIAIPLAALASERLDGRHVIDFSLDAAFDCEYPHETVVIIHSSSMLNLPHTLIPAKADLSILPRPFYQQNSFLPEMAFLVIPNNPTVTELQAALTVSAAFGRMSGGQLDLQLIKADALTEELRANSHLVIAGNSVGLSGILQQISFPDAVTQPGDGVIQTVVSPWNPSRVVLHISGTDEEGVLKAAQALTFGIIQPGENVQTAVISSVNPTIVGSSVAVVRSFADLGYLTRSVNGLGLNTLEYRFYMPPGYVLGNDPYLNLVYSHSALLDFSSSGMAISLNDQLISSVSFDEETASQLNTLKVPLYADLLQPGDNRLVLQVDMLPVSICSALTDRGVWFTSHASSLFNLPLLPAQVNQADLRINLSQYPYPFTSTPTLSDVGFVLANNDFESWAIASRLVAQLARRATGQILTPQVAFADAIAEDFLMNHLIVVGIPVTLPLISQMADAMPAPFEPGSNIVTERSLTVSYRLSEDASLGFIELFTSPWNSERLVLAVLGSTPEGLEWAFNAMTVPSLRGRVIGDYVVVNRTQVLATDTRVSGTTLLPDANPVLSELATPTSPAKVDSAPKAPNWIFPTIIIVSLLITSMIGFIVINMLRKVKK